VFFASEYIEKLTDDCEKAGGCGKKYSGLRGVDFYVSTSELWD
jgi:hypothetical protein